MYFNNGDTSNQGNDTLSLSGGAVKFVVDPNITQANQQDQAILKGNISATNASVIFALNNTDGITGVNPFINPNADSSSLGTYYVDGGITISNGGLSAFWDDEKGFVAKIALTDGHTFSQTGGFIGKNDAWFKAGSFTTGNNTFSSIQATLGASHLVFEDAVNISGGISTSNNGSAILLFKGAVQTSVGGSIEAGNNSSITFNAGATTGKIWNQKGGDLTLLFGGDVTIAPNDGAGEAFYATNNGGTSSTITAEFQGNTTINNSVVAYTTNGTTNKNTLTFKGATNVITGNVTAYGNANQYSRNSINEITFDENTSDNTIQGKVYAISSKGAAQNIITFKGQTSNKIEGVTENSKKIAVQMSEGLAQITFSAGASTIVGDVLAEKTGTSGGGRVEIGFTDGVTEASIQGNLSVAGDTSASIVFSNTGTQAMNGISVSTTSWGGNAVNTVSFSNGTSSTISGNINVSSGQNTITFNGTNNLISGNITTTGGTNTIITANQGATKSSLTGSVSAQSGTNNITMNTLDMAGKNITAKMDGRNNINISNDSTIGAIKILDTNAESAADNAQNTINFSGNTLTIQSGISTRGKWGSSGINQINLTASSAVLNISDLGITTKKINYEWDHRFVQQNIITFSDGGQLNLSGSDKTDDDNFDGILALNANKNTITFQGSANATLTAVDIRTKDAGINTIKFQGSGTNTLSSQVSAMGGTNTIAFSGANSINAIDGAISASNGTNTIAFSGTNTTNTISNNISVNGNGSNAISFAGSLSIVGSSAITLTAQWGQNNITSSNGSNIILGSQTNKIALNAYGDSADKVAQNNITTTGSITAHFSNISSYSNNHNNNGYHKNIITGGARSNIIIESMSATQHANNINEVSVGANSSILVTGNITSSTGKNNFIFTGDDSTLTLKGSTNQISTLTAFSTATNGNTLISDGTNNANTTTIDILTNGDKLTANFKGAGEGKEATLIFSNATTIKDLTLGENSTGNTLFFNNDGWNNINENVNVGSNQEITIKIEHWAGLYLKGGLTTDSNGASTILVSGSGLINANADVTASKLLISSSSPESNIQFQKDNTQTANFSFGEFVTNATTNNLQLKAGTTSLTLGTTSNSVSEEDPVVFGNISYLGNSAQSLAINGGENIINTLALNTQSDTLSIGGGSTTITNAITSNTNNNLTLQIGSSDSSKSASLALSGAITTANTQNGTQGVANVIFTGSTTASSNLATLTLGGNNNTLTGVTTQTANALIEAGANTSNLGTLTFSGTSGTQSLQINGGKNTITSLALNSTAGVQNILTQNAGNTTITNAISVGANNNLTLKIGSNIEPEKPRSSSIVLNEALTITDSTSGLANLVFEGGSSPSQTNHYSALVLKKGTSQFSSIDSNSSNAMLILDNSTSNNPSVSVSNQITIEDGKSLTIGFLGDGDSTATASQGIVVKDGGTLGIAIGGASGNKTIAISDYNFDNVFQKGSTLRIDFLENSGSTGIIGNGSAISIKDGRKSMINFYGGSGNPSLQGGISLDGGENEVNFYGSATLGNITLNSGKNTIRVKRDLVGFTATITNVNATDGTGLGKVTNDIYLEENATLKLGTAGDQVLTSTDTTKPSTLNFIGNGATLQGGFKADGGSAIINVGLDEFYDADKGTEVSGTITGAVSNASLNFNAGTSILTLQSQTNTFTEINSQAKDGVLVLDTTNGAVNATISGKTTINTGKSLSFDFQGDQNSTITTTGGLVIDGTLGVIISGSGAKKVEGDINLNGRGTLYVNYAGGNATVTLGDGDGITIGEGESSVIDFNSTSGTLANALTLDGGSNTINFNQSAELDKITLTSGYNTFNVADTKTATIGDTSDVGGVHNTINLGAGSTINLKSGSGSGDGSGSIITSLNNTLYFNGNGATLKGSFGANKGGSARVNVAGSGSVITGSLSNASITFSSDTADLTLQSGNSTITSLTGYTAPSTYTRNGRTITRTITNTLTLDDTADSTPVSATITSAVVGDSVGLKFGDGGESKTFTFQANGNHLTGVAFGTTSTNNTLEFTNGNSTLDSVTLASNSDLTIKLGDANLTLTGGYAKGSGDSAKLSVTGNAGIIANNQIISVDTLSFDNTTASSLSVSNSGTNTFASVDANSNAGTLIANDSTLTITALTGNNLTAGFSGNGTSRIAINGANSGGKTITLADVVLNNNANGTLDLSLLENTTITNSVNVGANQSLAINLGGTSSTLILEKGLSNSGNATINAGATSNTMAGSSIALSNLNLGGTGANTTTLTASNVTINTLNANATGTNTLKLNATSGNVSASINTISKTTRSVGDLDIALNSGDNTATLSLNGNTINSLDIQGDNNNLVGNARIETLSATTALGGGLVLDGGVVSVGEQIAPTNNLALTLNNGAKLTAKQGLDSTNAEINLTLNNSTLSLGADSTITSLSGNGGVIDFVSSGKDTSKSLTISGDCDANANVITYVDTSKSDKANLVKVEGTGSGILTISAYGNADEIFSITYDATDTNGTNVKVAEGVDKAIGGTSDIDGEIIQITLTEGATGNWYIGSAISKGVDTSVQEVVTSALAVNYDLYLANFNSLNKRMGELRNTQESNGVWARVFGGAMSNDFGVGSKTDYITTQAGYDYSLSVGENARNFIGVAIAYGASSTKSNPSSNPNTGALDNISSSMVEVGLYNSYVSDSGWYNDTIFKFDYIMSDFTLKTGANSQQNSTNNFAMILSDEFGYRHSFGENEKGSWYIDPQLELAFGYFNQSDFNQALNESATMTIKATQDSILTLRSRVGASLGKKFNTDKGFASLYVGAFYEYDYIEGGKSDYALISSQGEVSNPLQSLESNGRAILNVGSNIELTKGARLYIDVEKSFGDKQRTFMQFNLGARYSF